MKHLLTLTLALFIVTAAKSQTSNLAFFTENGERFSVILNGMLQNDQPETNIVVTDLPAPSYKVKIIFEDKNLKEFSKTLYVNPGSETTYAVKYVKKKGYTLRMMNSFPVEQDHDMIPGQMVVGYNPQGVSTNTGAATTIVNTTTINNNVTISANGVGNNVNVVNSNDGAGSQQAGSLTGINTETGAVHPEPYVLPDYYGPYGCPRPMSRGDFEQAKASIASKSFEDSKFTIAKQIIQSNCLLSLQVKEIMLLFTFESTRLDFAKFAYAYTLDLRNYYKLNDAFTFESSIDDLDRYIQNTGR
jgi:hypothetical protein